MIPYESIEAVGLIFGAGFVLCALVLIAFAWARKAESPWRFRGRRHG